MKRPIRKLICLTVKGRIEDIRQRIRSRPPDLGLFLDARRSYIGYPSWSGAMGWSASAAKDLVCGVAAGLVEDTDWVIVDRGYGPAEHWVRARVRSSRTIGRLFGDGEDVELLVAIPGEGTVWVSSWEEVLKTRNPSRSGAATEQESG